MNKVQTTLLSITSILVLTGWAFTVSAQAQLELSNVTDATYSIETGTTADCDDANERCEPNTRVNDTSVTSTGELDKATPAAATTNVCDGVTCADGSCAATLEMCVAMEAETTAIREGGRTVDAGTAPEQTRVPANTDRDGVPEFRDVDSDGDGIDDGTERAQNHNSSQSNRTSGMANDYPDSDGDGWGDDIAPAQDYNSTRSNRRKNVFADDTIDMRPEVSMRAGGFVKLGSIEGEASSRVSSGEVVCWGRAEDENGQVYSWGRGICVASEMTTDTNEQAHSRLTALQVRGNDVRAWNNNEQSAWREYLNTRVSTSAKERVLDRMIENTRANNRVQEIISDDESIEMRYSAQMRLFGLLPIEREVVARLASNSEIEIDYPWYRILSTTPDKNRITAILQDVWDSISL